MGRCFSCIRFSATGASLWDVVVVAEGRGRYMLKDFLLGLIAMDWIGAVVMDNPIATRLWLLWQIVTSMVIVATSDDNEVRGYNIVRDGML